MLILEIVNTKRLVLITDLAINLLFGVLKYLGRWNPKNYEGIFSVVRRYIR
jgi:hypothetical protein